MSRKKEILAAGYIRDILFETVEDMEQYLDNLEHRKQLYKVLQTYEREDRSVIIRILQQYNNSPLIQLFND